jgi:homoserine dehydrogenase
MDAIYHLKPNELNADFFKALQETFMGKEIAVTVSEISGTTEYLLSNEENRRRLLNAIEDAKNSRYAHTMTLDEMEAMVQ